jgi:hypothetical protein
LSAYHQMGHQTANLVFEPELASYRGAILSPVNDDEEAMRAFVDRARADRPGFELIFDPQLYVPDSSRERLRAWSHYPADVDTADINSDVWWAERVDQVGRVVERVVPDAVCSPAVLPRVFSGTTYYARMVDAGDRLHARVTGLPVLQTVMVGLDDMSVEGRPEEVASIISASQNERIFLVVVSDVDPRRELADVDGLAGVMRFIRLLEAGGQNVLVGFSSSDLVLWKAAGANSCATGRNFNLRRFTRSRFEAPPEGGGPQLGYWFEEGLLAYLRQADVIRVERNGGFSDATKRNPYSARVLEAIRAGQPPWLGLGWRHYMWWFSDFERRGNLDAVRNALRIADDAWGDFESRDILMDERQNNGAWVRHWRQAITESRR